MENSTSASNSVLNPEDSQVSATSSSSDSMERTNYDDYPAELFVDLRIDVIGSYMKYYFNETRRVSLEDAQVKADAAAALDEIRQIKTILAKAGEL